MKDKITYEKCGAIYGGDDLELVDYQYFSLEDTGLYFRGPQPEKLEKNQYFVCLGGAQTAGRFCPKPYPKILEYKLKFPALNLGVGGAGPYFFLKNEQLFSYINEARFVVVQIMSGRSESNSFFDSGGLEYLTRRADGVKIGSDAGYKELIEQKDIKYVKNIVRETRLNWLKNFQALLKKIQVPKILFWFSNRSPYLPENYKNVHALFGRYPQLVNSEMVKKIREDSDEYIKCISTRGNHHLHISRFTNEPTLIKTWEGRQDLIELYGAGSMFDTYYPSPEMHIDAALSLENVCKKYLNRFPNP